MLALKDRATWQRYDKMIYDPIDRKEDPDTASLSSSSRLALLTTGVRLHEKLPLVDTN